MKNRFSYIRFVIVFALLQIFAGAIVCAQDVSGYGKTAISFNLTRMATNEINMSVERFLSSRKSIELNFGLVYVNEFWDSQVNDWINADAAIAEHGYAVRLHYKIFKRQETVSKWRDYIAPGIVFKNVYYNDMPVVSDLKPDYIVNDTIILTNNSSVDTAIYKATNTVYYTESLLQKRTRMIFGIQFLWGKVYEASQTLAFEFYFGAGLNATIAKRTDHNRYATYLPKSYHEYDSVTDDAVDDNQRRNQSVPDFVDNSFYLRPNVQAGIKLRIRF